MSGQQQLPLGFEPAGQEPVRKGSIETDQAARRERPVLRAGSRRKESVSKEQAVEKLSERERKQWQAIDVLLADQPEAFKRTVFELCRQLDWPDDEPGFLLAIVSNRLFALAQQYPQLLSEAMQGATKGAFEQWKAVQAKLNLSAVRQETALGHLDAQLLQVQESALAQILETQQAFEREREVRKAELAQERQEWARAQAQQLAAVAQERNEVTALLERERGELARERKALMTLMGKERSAMVEVAKQQAKEQKDVLDKRTTEVVAQVTRRAYQGMDEQVMRIVNTVRTKHYLEASFYAFMAIVGVLTTSWAMAWYSRGQVEADTIWGDIERWNGDHVRECIKAKQTTCNIHIEVPDHPVEQ